MSLHDVYRDVVMTLDEIKFAVDNKECVYWKSKEYQVCRYSPDQNVTENNYPAVEYFIHHQDGGTHLDLTWSDGITLHGNECDFTTTA